VETSAIDERNVVDSFWNCNRLIIRDALIEDINPLTNMYMATKNLERWMSGQLDENDITNYIKNGHLPPNGERKFYKIQSITLKETNEIVGYIEFYHGYPDKQTIYIATLLIDDKYRSQGYGQEIIKKLFENALELKYLKIRLVVALKNWPAIYFWTKLGFTKISLYCGDKVFSKENFASLELEKSLI